MTYKELADCVLSHGLPRLADPTWKEWTRLSVYALAFALSARVASIRHGVRRHRMWALLAVLVLLLGIERLFDSEAALTAVGRCVAHRNDWYAQRRHFQLDVLIALAALGVAGFLAVAIALGEALRESGAAFLGLCILVTFVLMRMVSYHNFDAVIASRAFGISANLVFESVGLVMICVNAIWLIRRHRRPRTDAG